MSLEVFLNEMTNELDKKYLTFSEKLHFQKEILKNEFKKKLVDLVKLSSTINSNSDSNDGKSKEELSKAASTLKRQIQTLIDNMELMEQYVSQISNKKNEELIKIKEDNFTLADTNFGVSLSSAGEENVDANPASKKKRDILCFDCKSVLIWGDSWEYSNSCTYSNNCNVHYKYKCTKCSKRFCTNCKYPMNINTCGCNRLLVRSTTLYSNNCDLCRNSNITNGYRCGDCDYDVCDSCFNTK